MNSTVIKWGKSAPNDVDIAHKNNKQPKRLIIKTALSKDRRQQQRDEEQNKRNTTNEPQWKHDVRFNTLASEAKFYKPLESTNTESVLLPKSRANDKISIYRQRTVCSSRGALATFFIGALILIAAGIAAAVVFTVIKADDSSSSSSDSSNQNLAVGTATELPMSTVSVGSQSGSPCSSSTYTSINDPSRNYNYTGSQGTCDNGDLFTPANGGAWIRFEGSGGTQIPSWPVDLNHCGAFTAFWSNSTLTTTTNVMQNVTLCANGASTVCVWVLKASAIYCPGNYYVYFLPPILSGCKARYCTA